MQFVTDRLKFFIPSSHRRQIDGELNRQAKRRQSVTKLNESVKKSVKKIESEKALSNLGHSARAPTNFKLFKNLAICHELRKTGRAY